MVIGANVLGREETLGCDTDLWIVCSAAFVCVCVYVFSLP